MMWLRPGGCSRIIPASMWWRNCFGRRRIMAVRRFVALIAVAHRTRPLNDRTAHWVLMQPIRGAGGESAQNERSLRLPQSDSKSGCRSERRAHGPDHTAHFTAARRWVWMAQAGLGSPPCSLITEHGSMCATIF